MCTVEVTSVLSWSFGQTLYPQSFPSGDLAKTRSSAQGPLHETSAPRRGFFRGEKAARRAYSPSTGSATVPPDAPRRHSGDLGSKNVGAVGQTQAVSTGV